MFLVQLLFLITKIWKSHREKHGNEHNMSSAGLNIKTNRNINILNIIGTHWTNACSLTTPLFLCTVFMTYMFSEQYNRQHANHFISPQLSDHSKQQLLLMEGRREQDKQRNKQSGKLGGKEASKIILFQQSDFWKPLSIWQCLWHPVMLSVQSVLIMDVRGCVRCHLHIINTWFSWGRNLHSLKWLHFAKNYKL